MHSSLSGKIHCIDLNIFITECCPSSINFAQASSCPWTTPSAQCPDLKEDPPPAGLIGLCNLSIISQQVAVMSQFFKSSDCPGLLEKSAHMWTVLDHSSWSGTLSFPIRHRILEQEGQITWGTPLPRGTAGVVSELWSKQKSFGHLHRLFFLACSVDFSRRQRTILQTFTFWLLWNKWHPVFPYYWSVIWPFVFPKISRSLYT